MNYKNFYCDTLASYIYEFAPRARLEDFPLTKEDDKLLCEYAALKNKLSGVSEVNLSCLDPQNALSALKKYGLKGCAVVSAKNYRPGEGVLAYIENLLAYGESELAEVAILSAKKPILINFGRSLYELGQIDKAYSPPTKLLEEIGFLEHEAFILGGNFLDKDELSVLSQYDARIVISPRADMLLGRGFVNLSPLKSQGLSLGFASDVSPKINMLDEVLLAAGQTANLMYDTSIVDGKDLIKFIESGVKVEPSQAEKERFDALREQLKYLLQKL